MNEQEPKHDEEAANETDERSLPPSTTATGLAPYPTPEALVAPASPARQPTAPPYPSAPSPTPGPQANAPARNPTLRGDAAPIQGRGPFAVVEALLQAPANLLYEVQNGRGTLFKLGLVVLVTMSLTGAVIAAFSGGYQFLWVPTKMALGAFFCALICLPSLHILSSLAGAQQSLRETWAALLMGVALTGVLLVGFAPVTWVFSQATSSSKFMGSLHLVFLALSAIFGLGLVNRVLAATNGRKLGGVRLWGALFLLVVFQMSTTLRPIVGEYDGTLFHEKLFFLNHWFSSVS